MTASVIEAYLARVKTVLDGHTSAAASVFRGLRDGLDEEDMPGINIVRDDSGHDRLSDNGDRIAANFEIEHFAKGDDYETGVDALHMEVHALLAADATLKTLGRGLRCTGTSVTGAGASCTAGKLTARYEVKVFVRPSDLTRAV
jgi:hypothetical protein